MNKVKKQSQTQQLIEMMRQGRTVSRISGMECNPLCFKVPSRMSDAIRQGYPIKKIKLESCMGYRLEK